MKCRLLLFACLAIFGCATDAPQPSLLATAVHTESGKLRQILEEYFEEYLPLFPTYATLIGDHRYDDRLGLGITTEHRAKQRELYLRYIGKLADIERGRLSPAEALSLAVFNQLLKDRLESLTFPQHLLPLRQLYSTPIEFPLLGSGRGIHPFKSVRTTTIF